MPPPILFEARHDDGKQVALVVFSSLSFPLQLESKYSKRKAVLDQIRDLTARICKEGSRVVRCAGNSSPLICSKGSP